MITELTPEQNEILTRNRDFFIKSALTFKEIDQERCNKYIDWVYQFCGFEAPEKIYVSSPFAAQEKINELEGNEVKKYYEFSSYISIWYQSWYAYYKSMQDIGVTLSEDFTKLLEFNDIGIYDCIEMDKVCIICERPIKVVRNNGLLHNPNGPAIEWRDGYKLYFINGRSLPAWIWEKNEKGLITKEDFLNETNMEIKGGIYSVLGQKKIADLFNLIEIDKQVIHHEYGDETVTLLKTKDLYPEIDNQPFMWVKVQCPSTSTEYMLGVEPTNTDAVEALASTFSTNAKDYILNNAT